MSSAALAVPELMFEQRNPQHFSLGRIKRIQTLHFEVTHTKTCGAQYHLSSNSAKPPISSIYRPSSRPMHSGIADLGVPQLRRAAQRWAQRWPCAR